MPLALGPRRRPSGGVAGSPTARGTTVTQVYGLAGPGPKSRAEAPANAPDLHRCTRTRFCAHILCKRECAQVLCTLWLTTTPRTRAARCDSVWLTPASRQGAGPPAALTACSGPCGGRPVDGHRPRRACSAPTPAPRATTCASSSRSAWSRTPSEGEGKRRLVAGGSEYHSWHAERLRRRRGLPRPPSTGSTRDYVRHFSEQYDRWLDVAATWPMAWRDALRIERRLRPRHRRASSRRCARRSRELIERYRRVGQGNPQARASRSTTFAYPSTSTARRRPDGAVP